MRLLSSSVADPYHFDKDPDPGCEKFLPDPGKNDIDPWIKYQENVKNRIKCSYSTFCVCVYYLPITFL